MEIRRVQLTGGSSYVMTLPKEWVKQLNIKKNDPLCIYLQTDGTLMVTPRMTEEHKQKTKEFNITHISNQNELLRRLISAYLAGFNSIKINSTRSIPPTIRSLVRNYTQITIGQEIIEESDNQIILKDLLNPTEMPFERTIKRMHIIVKGMYEDARQAIETKDVSPISDMTQRDNEVDRLHWLVARQHNSILQNVGLAEKLHATIETSLTYFLISRILERIGDHVVRIAATLPSIKDLPTDDPLIKHIITASKQSQKALNCSITSFLRKNITEANHNIEEVEKFEKLCEDINSIALTYPSKTALSVGYIIESIKRIAEYSTDISETTINHLTRFTDK